LIPVEREKFLSFLKDADSGFVEMVDPRKGWQVHRAIE